MWSYLIPLLTVLLFLAAILLFRTAFYSSEEEQIEAAPAIDVDSRQVAEHLARLIRCETVVLPEPEKFPKRAFRAMQRELESMFPRVHRTLEAEAINDYSLLYCWNGSNPDLKPVLLTAHQDVVPIEPGSETQWERGPFSGDIVDGYVWGRGSLDNKFAIVGILEAIECLLQEGFHPVRSIYLAFGHDEEVGGYQGAARIAQVLKERGVEAEMVLDEGGMICEGILKGVKRPVALVGVAEKGFLTLELKAEGPAGHSAAPGAHGTIPRLSRAIARLDARPMRARLDDIQIMYRKLAGELPFGYRLALANTWLLGGLFKKILEKEPTTNAMIRTTIAPTMLKAGLKDNLLPGQASAVINCRLLPGDSLEKVTERVRRLAAKDRVSVRSVYPGENPEDNHEATPIADLKGKGYGLLSRVIRQTFPDVTVSPYLVIGGTDARHYTLISKQVLRFSPVRYTPADYARVHGINERISVKACGDIATFYRRLIEACTQ